MEYPFYDNFLNGHQVAISLSHAVNLTKTRKEMQSFPKLSLFFWICKEVFFSSSQNFSGKEKCTFVVRMIVTSFLAENISQEVL